MAISSTRQRLYADMQRHISIILQRDMDDPDMRQVFITRMSPSPKGSTLTVWWCAPDDFESQRFSRKLSKLQPMIASRLRHSIRQRAPKFMFKFDEAFHRGNAVLSTLHEMEKHSPNKNE